MMTFMPRWVFAVVLGASALAAPLPIDQAVTPEGIQVALPRLKPKVIALSPDRRTLVTSGANHEIIVLDPVSGTVRQKVALPVEPAEAAIAEVPTSFRPNPDSAAQASFCGLAFSPDGRRLYLSTSTGSIKVFSCDANGTLAGERSLALPPANAPHRVREIPSGLAISPDNRRLYVAGNLSNTLLELDAESGAVLRQIAVGVEPYDVVLTDGKAYVSNWGGRRPTAPSGSRDGADNRGTAESPAGIPTGPAGLGTTVRVDPRTFVASEGSVSVIDLKAGRVLTEIITGRHASGLAVSPDGKYVVVANANEDTLSVIDPATDRVAETISVRWNPSDLFGASPNALAFGADGKTLFVCHGTQNAVAVISFAPGHSKLQGLIPVGWFPGAIAFDPERRALYVANLKGEGDQSRTADHSGFQTRNYIGTVSIVPVPEAKQLTALTGRVLTNYRHAVMEAALAPARSGQPPRPVPERAGEPSVFKHVIYLIKENRTYDQVLGDMKEGNGDPALCVFGEAITPNQHKIAREFVLLDNVYCAGVLSADGHQWATTAVATDYIEKSFAGFPRSYPFGGSPDAIDAMAYSPTGFIWDNAIAHGLSFRNYGEFTLATVRWRDPQHKGAPRFVDIHRDYAAKTGLIEFSNTPGIASLGRYSNPATVGWGLNVPDQFRVDRFLEEFRTYEQQGDLPALIVLYLPNDHTQGTRAGAGTPESYQADNDLAMGRVVEALSHSAYWKDTCLFAIEDDPQNGWDHVSGYRTTGYVVSAYTRRHVTVSDRYTQPGMLRTMELMLGLPPMNQLDASATPMAACFTDRPDLAPFQATPARVSLDTVNPPAREVSDRTRRRDIVTSEWIDFTAPDRANEEELNGILWRAMKGSRTPFPRWAVLANPHDDDKD
jgi:YVTN family beta-propeller protein